MPIGPLGAAANSLTRTLWPFIASLFGGQDIMVEGAEEKRCCCSVLKVNGPHMFHPLCAALWSGSTSINFISRRLTIIFGNRSHCATLSHEMVLSRILKGITNNININIMRSINHGIVSSLDNYNLIEEEHNSPRDMLLIDLFFLFLPRKIYFT